jgi:hypothetical protein
MPPRSTRLAALAVLAAAAGASLAACRSVPSGGGAPLRPDSARIRADVAYLADDRLEGRLTGTAGNDSAAAYIARQLAAIRGVRAIVSDSGARASWQQRFVARSAALAHAGRRGDLRTQNVVGFLPGRDPALRGQVVVLGAHYDHLGRDATFATDTRAGDAIRNGADDNASGTAAVLELARLLAANPPRRSVAFVLFSGEELGLLGSQWFVEHMPVPTDSVVAMLNFDMVGRLSGDSLIVYGTATATELPALLDSANAAGPRLQVKGVGDGFGPSDHSSFYAKNLPVLHFFTNLHDDYHAATDDLEKLNAGGAARVVELAHAVTRQIAERPARLTFQRAPSVQSARGPGASGPSASGPRPYLGSVPDMSSDGENGLRLQGVTPGSPADKAGLKGGDVIVEFDGKPVTDLYTYTDALYGRKPGDEVQVVVRRGTARVPLTVTLGRRGE